MKEGHNDNNRPGHQPLPGFDGTGPLSGNGREAVDDDFPGDAEDIYEEPDRDTNHTGGFREEHVEDEDFDEDFDEDDLQETDDEVFNEQDEFLRSAVSATLGAVPPGAQTEREREANYFQGEPHRPADPQERDVWEEDDYEADDEEWLAEEPGYPDDDDDDSSRRWPLGLIAVGAVALVLIIAGGLGIIQQRAATEEEIRELRAQLATRASPEDVSSSRAALQRTNERNTALTGEMQTLQMENRRLRERLAELETQLAEARTPQATVPAQDAGEMAAGAAQNAPTPAAPGDETVAPQAPAATTGDWFVNFGSYGQQAMAREWAQRIAPAAGEVIVAESTQDGNTLYRVRVVGLASRTAAENVARELQADWGLPRLWVGRQ